MEYKIPTASIPSIFSFLAILSLLLFVTVIFSFSDWNVGAVVAISEASPVKGLAGTRFIGRNLRLNECNHACMNYRV